MPPLRVVGIDPGFASIGLASVDLQRRGSVINAIKLVKTKPSAKKRKIAATADESTRLAEIVDAVRTFFDKWKPQIVAIEDPPWGKNAKAVRTCALMWGAVYGVARDRGIPLVNLSAQAVKKMIVGSNSASKEEVLAALKYTHPGFTDWPTTNDVEHVADATAVAIASRDEPLVYALLAIGADKLPSGR